MCSNWRCTKGGNKEIRILVKYFIFWKECYRDSNELQVTAIKVFHLCYLASVYFLVLTPFSTKIVTSISCYKSRNEKCNWFSSTTFLLNASYRHKYVFIICACWYSIFFGSRVYFHLPLIRCSLWNCPSDAREEKIIFL